MSAETSLGILFGEARGTALGMTWVAPTALRELTSERGADDEPAMLEAVASAIGCDIAFVPAEQPWAGEAAARLRSAGIGVAWAVAGVLGRVADEFGWSEVLRRSASEPETLVEALDHALEDALAVVRESDGVADAVVVADDLASTAGWLVPPDYAMDALVPRYHVLALAGAALAQPVIFHSDGDIRALFPSLASAGFSAVHLGGADRQVIELAMPVAARHDLALLGGVTAESIHAEGARHLGEHLARLSVAGRLIICDDGGITAAEEVAALASVFDAVRQYSEADATGPGRIVEH